MEHWAGRRFALVAFESVFSMESISCPEMSLRRRILGFNMNQLIAAPCFESSTGSW